MKVMIVDDAPANRLVLTALLKSAGYDAIVADGSAAALRIFAEERPEVVLTDLHLEDGTSGLELARSLRQQAEGRPFRIAIVTGDPDQSLAADPTVDAVIEKPVSLDGLKSFINQEAQ